LFSGSVAGSISASCGIGANRRPPGLPCEIDIADKLPANEDAVGSVFASTGTTPASKTLVSSDAKRFAFRWFRLKSCRTQFISSIVRVASPPAPTPAPPLFSPSSALEGVSSYRARTVLLLLGGEVVAWAAAGARPWDGDELESLADPIRTPSRRAGRARSVARGILLKWPMFLAFIISDVSEEDS